MIIFFFRKWATPSSKTKPITKRVVKIVLDERQSWSPHCHAEGSWLQTCEVLEQEWCFFIHFQEPVQNAQLWSFAEFHVLAHG